MVINERINEDMAVLQAIGKLTYGEGAQVSRRRVALLAGETKTVVLDAVNADYVDSSGIEALVRAHTLMKEAGGKFVVRDPHPKLKKLLQMTHLLDILNVEEGKN